MAEQAKPVDPDLPLGQEAKREIKHAELKIALEEGFKNLTEENRTCLGQTWTPEELLKMLQDEEALSEIAGLEGATPYWLAERQGRDGNPYMVLVIGSANKEPPEQLGGTYNQTRNWVLNQGVHSRMMTLEEMERRAAEASMTVGSTATWIESGENQEEATYAFSDSNGEVESIEAPSTLSDLQLGVYRVIEIPFSGLQFEMSQVAGSVTKTVKRRPVVYRSGF
jgi:hypothetical protein